MKWHKNQKIIDYNLKENQDAWRQRLFVSELVHDESKASIISHQCLDFLRGLLKTWFVSFDKIHNGFANWKMRVEREWSHHCTDKEGHWGETCTSWGQKFLLAQLLEGWCCWTEDDKTEERAIWRPRIWKSFRAVRRWGRLPQGQQISKTEQN